MGTNADLIHRWFEEVWNRCRAAAIEEILAPGATVHGFASGELTGPEAFRAFHSSFCETFSDMRVEIDRTVEEGDWVSAWYRVTATHRASGSAAAYSGAVLGRVRIGKLQEGWNSWDFLGLLAQLGAVDMMRVGPLLGA